MTPPAAAPSAHRNHGRARTGGGRTAAPARRAAVMPRGARRASGPAGGLGGLRMNGTPAYAGGGAAALGGGQTAYTPLGLRLARRCAGVQDARLLDRLIRGRLWIGLIAVMLIGLVFLQLSLLSLNAGIGENLQKSTILERQNAAMRTILAREGAGERVQGVAEGAGMVMPAAGSVNYVEAGKVSPEIAARGISAPSDAAKAQATQLAATAAANAAAKTDLTGTATAAPTATITPAATAPTATTPATTAPTATPDVPSTTAAPPITASAATAGTPQG